MSFKIKVRSIVLLFTLLGFSASAIDTAIVKLMQKVIAIEVNSSYPYFNLLNEAKNPEFNKDDLEKLVDRFPETKSIPVKEFLTAIESDSSAFKWSDYNLPRARCVDENHLPQYSYSNRILCHVLPTTPRKAVDSLEALGMVVVQAKPGALKRQIKIQEKKALLAYEAKWPSERRDSWAFSKPIFSKDGVYAMISVDKRYEGHYYILKNNNGHWDAVCRFKDWVS